MAHKSNVPALSGSALTTDDDGTPPAKIQKTARQAFRDSSHHISTAVAANDAPPEDGFGVRPTDADSSESNPIDMGNKKEMAEEGVRRAIKGLARMEKRLMRAVKIQQMEVQRSKVPGI
jgi:hypothetical protein